MDRQKSCRDTELSIDELFGDPIMRLILDCYGFTPERIRVLLDEKTRRLQREDGKTPKVTDSTNG